MELHKLLSMKNGKTSKDIKNEYIYMINGTVVERSSKNPNMPTGVLKLMHQKSKSSIQPIRHQLLLQMIQML